MTETLPSAAAEHSDEQARLGGENTPPAQAEAARATGRWFRRVHLAAVLLVVVVTVAAVAAVVVLYLRQDAATRVEATRGDALQAARQRLPEMLSYDYRSLDADLATARAALTGPFHREYSELQRTAVRPAAAAQKISTKTSVSAAGVVRASAREVVVLAFINQVTRSERQSTPRIDGARVRVTMRHLGDRWLVSRLDTV